MHKLRQHQLDAFRYTLKERHPALFMEMRLGKCLVTIRRCKLYKPINPVIGLRGLIVCPNSAVGSWIEELSNEDEPPPCLLMGSRAKRLDMLMNTYDPWYIINKEGHLALPEIAKVDWDFVILDESNFITNPRSLVSKFFLQNFRDVPHRWVLTGSPNPRGDLDFWPQLAFLDSQAFGFKTFWDFRAKKCIVQGFSWVTTSQTHKEIVQTVGKRCLIIRRKDYKLDLEKKHIVRELELPPDMRAQYEKVESSFELGNKTTIWATVQYQWLRAVCAGFLEEKLVWPGKITELVTLLQTELKDEPVPIWFDYNKEIFAVAEALLKENISHRILTGLTPLLEREQKRKDWIAGKFQVLLIQQRIAQMGMNLSHADTAIYFSEPSGPLASIQVEDRILSLDKKTILLYLHLIVKDSVESDMYQELRARRFTSDLSLSRALQSRMESRYK